MSLLIKLASHYLTLYSTDYFLKSYLKYFFDALKV